jgi:hypothetical protein
VYYYKLDHHHFFLTLFKLLITNHPSPEYYLLKYIDTVFILTINLSGFGGLEVECWPLVPKFAGSNPAEAFGFFRAKKSSARLPSEGK